jgi:hypothetical protein
VASHAGGSGLPVIGGFGPGLGPTPGVLCDPSGCGGGGGGGNPTCTPGARYYAGYNGTKPPIGSSVSAIIGEYLGSVVNGGLIAGWVGVASNASDSHGPLNWIQTGLAREGNGGALAFYIEDRVNGTWPTSHEFPVYDASAQESTQYLFTVTHNSSSNWTATIKTYPGGTVLYTATKTVSVDYASITGETWDVNSSSCDTMEFAFWGTTFPTGQPGDGDFSDLPYWVGMGSHGNDFSAVGP